MPASQIYQAELTHSVLGDLPLVEVEEVVFGGLHLTQRSFHQSERSIPDSKRRLLAAVVNEPKPAHDGAVSDSFLCWSCVHVEGMKNCSRRCKYISSHVSLCITKL
jgi:hypothetical protein